MALTATKLSYNSFKKRQCYNPNSNTTSWDVSGSSPVVRFQSGGSANFYGKYEFTIPSSIKGKLRYAVIAIPLASTAWPANIRYAIVKGTDVTPKAFVSKNVVGVYSDYCFYREDSCANLITSTNDDEKGKVSSIVYAKVDISGLTKGETYAVGFFERSDNTSANGYIPGVDNSAASNETITIYSSEEITITYNPGANGIGSQQTQIVYADEVSVLKGAIFSRAGYNQTGWARVDGGPKVYSLNERVIFQGKVTFYPYWEMNGNVAIKSDNGMLHGAACVFVDGEYKMGVAYIKTSNGYKAL